MKKTKQLVNKINIPGLISLLSLLSTWLAILSLLSDKLGLSIFLAVTAFLLDSADGFVARKLKLESEFGRQLDGMIDAFNYSLLSALVIWKELLPGILGIIVGFIVIATGIIRLAGFNQEGYISKKDILYYRGVVTCHLSLITFIFLVVNQIVQLSPVFIAATISIFAFLQLSNIKTRKTGVLLFWIPIALLIGYIGITWL